MLREPNAIAKKTKMSSRKGITYMKNTNVYQWNWMIHLRTLKDSKSKGLPKLVKEHWDPTINTIVIFCGKFKSITSSSQFTIKSPPSWHRSAKSRSFRKTIRALPRSPRKKNCVKSFASIFNLRIQFENNGRPKYELSKSERPWVKKIIKRPDITYTTAGKNQQKYLGKINGQSQYAQIRYLLWNLKVLLHILNGNATIDSERFLSKFSKDITFR